MIRSKVQLTSLDCSCVHHHAAQHCLWNCRYKQGPDTSRHLTSFCSISHAHSVHIQVEAAGNGQLREALKDFDDARGPGELAPSMNDGELLWIGLPCRIGETSRQHPQPMGLVGQYVYFNIMLQVVDHICADDAIGYDMIFKRFTIRRTECRT